MCDPRRSPMNVFLTCVLQHARHVNVYSTSRNITAHRPRLESSIRPPTMQCGGQGRVAAAPDRRLIYWVHHALAIRRRRPPHRVMAGTAGHRCVLPGQPVAARSCCARCSTAGLVQSRWTHDDTKPHVVHWCLPTHPPTLPRACARAASGRGLCYGRTAGGSFRLCRKSL